MSYPKESMPFQIIIRPQGSGAVIVKIKSSEVKSNIFILHDVISIGAILAVSMYLIYIWDHLPEQIPVHFTNGEADRYGSKWYTPLMILLTVIFYVSGLLTRRFAHKFSYQGKKIDSYAELKKQKLIISWTFLAAVLLFSIVSFEFIQSSLPSHNGLGQIHLIVLGALVTGLFTYYIFQGIKHAREKS